MSTYGSLGNGELLVLALVALAFLLKNLRDFVRYNFQQVAGHLAPHPLQDVATIASRALAAAAFPHLTRTAPRPMVRRRQAAVAVRAAQPQSPQARA
jgi:hypothetical protein